MDGVIKLCEDLEVGEGALSHLSIDCESVPPNRSLTVCASRATAEDVVMLVIAWLLKAAKMAEFTKVRRWRGPLRCLMWYHLLMPWRYHRVDNSSKPWMLHALIALFHAGLFGMVAMWVP